jgi:hypothetical protein
MSVAVPAEQNENANSRLMGRRVWLAIDGAPTSSFIGTVIMRQVMG